MAHPSMQNHKHDPQQAHGAAEPFHVLVQRVTFARQQPLKPDVHDLGGLSRASRRCWCACAPGNPPASGWRRRPSRWWPWWTRRARGRTAQSGGEHGRRDARRRHRDHRGLCRRIYKPWLAVCTGSTHHERSIDTGLGRCVLRASHATRIEISAAEPDRSSAPTPQARNIRAAIFHTMGTLFPFVLL